MLHGQRPDSHNTCKELAEASMRLKNKTFREMTYRSCSVAINEARSEDWSANRRSMRRAICGKE